MKLHKNLNTLLFTLAFAIISISPSFAAEKALQTQFGSNGVEVDLIRAKKSGKALSVVLSFRNPKKDNAFTDLALSETYFVDNQESKKYHVLRDEKGEWLAGPISTQDQENTTIIERIEKGGNVVVWFKFPMPPENVTHIQLNIPTISPFDDVEISR